MTSLLLKFNIILESGESHTARPIYGPLFHRWLPDGEKDAITLPTRDENAQLSIWFERRGFVDFGLIEFDYKRREVDQEKIIEQGVLDAGPLTGLLEIKRLSEEELQAVLTNSIGDIHYIELGKRLLKSYIFPPVSRFINLLRINYGQYWIQRIKEWDSRERSLGGYYKFLMNASWSLDGDSWSSFIPNDPIRFGYGSVSTGQEFLEFIRKEDWREIEQILQTDYEPSIAAILLARTHQLLDRGDTKYALIEGVSSLELAVQEFLREKIGRSDLLRKEVQAFWNLPLIAQVISIGASKGTISKDDIEYTIKSIKIRHELIHEGKEPPENAKEYLLGLVRTIAALLSGPKFRFPKANPGNAILEPEQWEASYKASRARDRIRARHSADTTNIT